MNRNIRTASICHNEDTATDTGARRVRLQLRRVAGGGYEWATEYDEDCNIGVCRTVADAEQAALHAWGAEIWDFRATWANR